MKLKAFNFFILIFVLFLLSSPTSYGQGKIVVKLAQELTESILKKFGKEGAKGLFEFGGEKAVKELLEKTFLEGGENLTKRAVYFGKTYGVSALRVLNKSPKVMLNALDDLPMRLVQPAINAARREPELVVSLVNKYGKSALEMAAKHPGVGTKIANSLGEQGIVAGLNLSTRNAIRLSRYADDIKKLPPKEKNQILVVIGEAAEKVFNYLEKHPKVLITSAVVTTALASKEEIFGSKEKEMTYSNGKRIKTSPSPGFLVSLLKEPLEIISFSVALGCFFWFATVVWNRYKIAKVEQSTAQLKSTIEIEKLKKDDPSIDNQPED